MDDPVALSLPARLLLRHWRDSAIVPDFYDLMRFAYDDEYFIDRMQLSIGNVRLLASILPGSSTRLSNATISLPNRLVEPTASGFSREA